MSAAAGDASEASEEDTEVQIYSSEEEEEAGCSPVSVEEADVIDGPPELSCPLCGVTVAALVAEQTSAAAWPVAWQKHQDTCRGLAKRSRLGACCPAQDPWFLQVARDQLQMLVSTLISLDWKSRRKVHRGCPGKG